jgi:Ca-activated chloride channel homolog
VAGKWTYLYRAVVPRATPSSSCSRRSAPPRSDVERHRALPKGDYAGALDQFVLVDTPESWFDQGNALAYLKKYPDAIRAYSEALRERPRWREAEENLALVRSLIPPPPKQPDQQESPDLKPDQIKFDEKGKKGRKRLTFSKQEMADVWMRNIQTSPADFLRQKFAMESFEEKHR